MSMFQRRHYEALALLTQNSHPGAGLSDDNRAKMQWCYQYNLLADMLRRDNPNFDIARFKRACFPGNNLRVIKP